MIVPRSAAVLAGVFVFSSPGVPAGDAACVARGPEYYEIDLVGTRNVPGTGLGVGRAEVSTPPTSPFAVTLSADGSYRYELRVVLERMRPPRQGVLVAWTSTPELDQVRRLGALDDSLRTRGTTSWNKFLVVVTLEPGDDTTATRWTGPVAFRGMSRSGMMHTMAGHGAFQQENCAAYGYRE